MRYAVWRSGRTPAGAARVSTALRQSPFSPSSRRRSASASGPTALPRAATSRTGSPTTTNDGCTPPSTTKPQPKPELPGKSACPPRHNPKWCPEPCRLHRVRYGKVPPCVFRDLAKIATDFNESECMGSSTVARWAHVGRSDPGIRPRDCEGSCRRKNACMRPVWIFFAITAPLDCGTLV